MLQFFIDFLNRASTLLVPALLLLIIVMIFYIIHLKKQIKNNTTIFSGEHNRLGLALRGWKDALDNFNMLAKVTASFAERVSKGLVSFKEAETLNKSINEIILDIDDVAENVYEELENIHGIFEGYL